MEHYRQRRPQPPGTIRRHIGICLYPDEWATIEEDAASRDDSVAYVISRLLALIASNAIEGTTLRGMVSRALVYLENAEDELPVREAGQ